MTQLGFLNRFHFDMLGVIALYEITKKLTIYGKPILNFPRLVDLFFDVDLVK